MEVAPQTYKQLIVDGIRDLPTELLAEIADFVYFVRQRATSSDAVVAEQYGLLLRQDLQQMSAVEASHLEAEFEDYEQHYPPE